MRLCRRGCLLQVQRSSSLPALGVNVVAKRPYSEDGGYMKRRLQQLAEDATPIKDDPMAGVPSDSLEHLQNKTPKLYQKELANTSIPSYAPKHSHDIANTTPWTGDLSDRDQSVRNAVEKGKTKQQLDPLAPRQHTPKKSLSQRLMQAREKSLDYKLDKHSETKSDSGPSFKQLYAERFTLGGGTGTIASINSLASQRIEEAIAQGQFKNIRRGENQKIEVSDNPWVDQTEYILNRMVQRQGAAPPWIEKQGLVNTRIKTARETIANSFVEYAITTVSKAVESTKDAKDVDKKIALALQVDPKPWEKENEKYHTITVQSLNSAIRGFNLQAPGSARRSYLDVKSELAQCHSLAKQRLPEAIRIREGTREPSTVSKANLHSKKDLYTEDPTNYYGLKDLFKDVFRRSK